MKHRKLLLWLLSFTFLSACDGEVPEPLQCPLGTVRSGDHCVAPDSGIVDTGTPDGAVVDTGEPDPDATTSDVDPVDLGFPDSGVPDAGDEAATISAVAVDFGRTVLGTSPSFVIDVSNGTSAPVTVQLGTISGAEAADFGVAASSTTSGDTISLAPGAMETLTFTFTPAALGARNASFDIQLCGPGCPAEITLTGDGIQEAITCQPPSIDFGFVNPGACSTRSINCTNDSDHDATIAAWSLTGNSSPAYSFVPTSTVTVLTPADSIALDLEYCPTVLGTDNGTAVITIDHPDPSYSTRAIILAGIGGGPDIDCSADFDFGVVGVGQVVTRYASCTNNGNVPLLIQSLSLAPGTTSELTFDSSVQGSVIAPPTTIDAGETMEITMDYAPTAAGNHVSTFEIVSNDADSPNVTYTVTADAIDPSGCTVQVAPTSLDFGAVNVNQQSELNASVTNVGSGQCAISAVGMTAGSSPDFTIVAPTSGQMVNTGDTAIVTIRFAPTSVAALTGTVELQTTDPLNPSPTIDVVGAGQSPYGVVQTSPSAIDFGQLAVGCTNRAMRELRISNFTSGAVTIDVSLTSTTSDFSIEEATTTFPIPSNDFVDVTIGFLPTNVGIYRNRLQIDITGLPTLFVPVSGEGATVPQSTLIFPGAPPQVVDVLLVVDDSCSMQEEQNLLAAAAPIILDRGDSAGAEYHIGVTTTDPRQGLVGTLRGTPTVVDWTSATRQTDLQANINVGTTGSGTERGLTGARYAVTDATLLAGHNAGFLRSDGELTVIFISDEEDGSPQSVEQYLQDIAARPIGIPGSLRVFSISGGATGCTGSGGTAQPSVRYPSASLQTGGFDASICAPDFSDIMTGVADATFRTVDTFQLGSAPAPDSVVVEVDGVTAPPAEFGVEYATGRVVFNEGYAPPPTSTVEITYSPFCIPGTCGDAAPQNPEQCDDGNPINTDACLDSCYNAFCGDGHTWAGNEDCDDGNTFSGDGCNYLCVVEGCGNAIVEPPEECDLGVGVNSNTLPNTCRENCVDPYCHDGVTDTGEDCDDGNQNDTDACVDSCVDADCGDGHVWAGQEECDDGNQDPNDNCDNNCNWNIASFTVTSSTNIPLVPATGGTDLAYTSGSLVDGAAPLNIGFPFDFLGTTVTVVHVSTNGFITFENQGTSSWTNQTLPDPQVPNALVAWWWDDFNLDRQVNPAPSMTTQIIGTTPGSRVRVITLLNQPAFGGGSTLLNVEIRLYETSNVIEVHYGQAVQAGGQPSNWAATVGWESSGALLGVDVLGCGANCNTVDWPTDTVFSYTP